MKKLLTLLSSFALMTNSVIAVISCSISKKEDSRVILNNVPIKNINFNVDNTQNLSHFDSSNLYTYIEKNILQQINNYLSSKRLSGQIHYGKDFTFPDLNKKIIDGSDISSGITVLILANPNSTVLKPGTSRNFKLISKNKVDIGDPFSTKTLGFALKEPTSFQTNEEELLLQEIQEKINYTLLTAYIDKSPVKVINPVLKEGKDYNFKPVVFVAGKNYVTQPLPLGVTLPLTGQKITVSKNQPLKTINITNLKFVKGIDLVTFDFKNLTVNVDADVDLARVTSAEQQIIIDSINNELLKVIQAQDVDVTRDEFYTPLSVSLVGVN